MTDNTNDQKTNSSGSRNKPTQDLFFESTDPNTTNYPVRIGALFAHRDGKGHSIDDNGVLGLRGRLFTRDSSERLERLRGNKDEARDGNNADRGAEQGEAER